MRHTTLPIVLLERELYRHMHDCKTSFAHHLALFPETINLPYEVCIIQPPYTSTAQNLCPISYLHITTNKITWRLFLISPMPLIIAVCLSLIYKESALTSHTPRPPVPLGSLPDSAPYSFGYRPRFPWRRADL